MSPSLLHTNHVNNTNTNNNDNIRSVGQSWSRSLSMVSSNESEAPKSVISANFSHSLQQTVAATSSSANGSTHLPTLPTSRLPTSSPSTSLPSSVSVVSSDVLTSPTLSNGSQSARQSKSSAGYRRNRSSDAGNLTARFHRTHASTSTSAAAMAVTSSSPSSTLVSIGSHPSVGRANRLTRGPQPPMTTPPPPSANANATPRRISLSSHHDDDGYDHKHDDDVGEHKTPRREGSHQQRRAATIRRDAIRQIRLAHTIQSQLERSLVCVHDSQSVSPMHGLMFGPMFVAWIAS
jgi:hypothetical protein